MDFDGKYTVWFHTPLGEGTGIVHLIDGKITGGDCFFTYGGTYEASDGHFTATLTTRRFAQGLTPTVFGVDEIEVRLTGVYKDGMARCSGTADQAPDLRFEAILFGGGLEPPPAPAVRRGAGTFDAARLPRIPEIGPRSRNPFPPR